LQRWGRQLSRIHELVTHGPSEGKDIHILMLQCYGVDEISAAYEKPRRLRTADNLSSRERDKVCASSHESAQVGGRWQSGRSIHDDGHAVLVSYSHRVLQRDRTTHVHVNPVNSHGVFVNGRLNVPGVSIASGGIADVS